MRNGIPSQKEMAEPSNAQSGEPEYIDKSVQIPNTTFYPNRGMDAPAYVGNNPRYWEYR